MADGDAVAHRLIATLGVQRVPNRALDLFIARDFLDPERCACLCRMIDARRRPSDIADHKGGPDFRTSETCDFDMTDSLVVEVDRLLCDFLGISPSMSEAIQGQRYAAGQEFKPHTDNFNPGGVDFFLHCAEQGQRTWTAMLYLNQPEEGGATRFKDIGKTIQPETGKLVAWNNLLPDGSPNSATLHQGMKVRRGRNISSPNGFGSMRLFE